MAPYKIALNVKESFEAKELLRQRHLPNGSVENLVRWRLHGPEKKSSASEDSSSSGSLNEESKVGKDVFLWMTNHELMVCSPHLYNTESTNDQGPSLTLDESGLDEDALDASSDVEDLDDMRHDVIKLVNRAKKQMHRMKKEGNMKPLTSLSHTTKVLSTYAGLGSLANVFRETGALDLILELLWTNDVETRRAAGRMLRALALHDAGSRAYVLLSLTQDRQDEDSNDQKQHYADFENRAMVMEMFAETASGEEAHAVALDSVQLPQVPGKALFTLMKCYLRVTSLMDGNNKGENKRNQQKLAWMFYDTTKSEHGVIDDFVIAMAISDLIFELNNVMDWNTKSPKNGNSQQSDKTGDKSSDKSVSPPPTPTLFGARLKEMVRQIRKTKRSSDTENPSTKRKNSSGVQDSKTSSDVNRKPLFLQSARETTIDPLLLSSLLKAGEPSDAAYKHPSSFATRRLYADYVRSEIKPGFRVRACQSYQDVNEGDEGVYRQHNHSTPPVQVFWHRLNRTYWVYWHHIVLIGEGSDETSQSKPPVPFAISPEDSELWPFLNGMRDKVKNLYGVEYASREDQNEKNMEKKDEISQKNWWLLLFHASRASSERREKIKQYLMKKYPTSMHLCMIKADKEDALELMNEILKDVSAIDRENIKVSPICHLLISEIEKVEREEREKKKEAEKKEEISKEETSKKNETLVIIETNQTPGTSKDAMAFSTESKALEESKEEPAKEDLSLEERARAVEMGLRIGLIIDEETEKKYLEVFLDKGTYDLCSKLWKMQQESKNLLKISKFVPKSGRGGKIVALTCMKVLVKCESNDSFQKRKDISDVISNVHCAAEDSDSLVVSAYLQFILNCLQKQGDADEEHEMLMNLAITGHLKTVFDMIARFQDHKAVVYDAILCTSLILQATQFAKNPATGGDSAYMNLIAAIITSIFTSEHSSTSFETGTDQQISGATVLHAYVRAFEQLIADETRSQPANAEFNSAKRNQVLYSALCVLCMVARKDQSKSLLSETDFVLQIIHTGQTQCSNLSGPVRRMLQRLKGVVVTICHDPLEFEPGDDAHDRSDENNSDDEDVIITLFKGQPLIQHNSNDTLTDHITRLKSQHPDELRSTTATVINDLILPTLKKTSSLTSECAKSITGLKSFLSEFEGLVKEGNLILFESYWPVLVFFLQNILELCVSATNKSLSLDIGSDIVSILKTLSELDKDFAVFLCGLEAKQTIARLQEKHSTVPNATDLCELITSCERQRTLHNRLLAVVLGGCISTALHCIEEARRLQKQINIPLFDQLLSNLCKGADLELKEDKCYERLEVSSNPRQVTRLTDGNPKSYWESNGSSGAHWINVYMKKGIVVRKLSIVVAQEDSSYMPSRIVVFGGTTPSDITTQLACVNVSSTDRDVVVLENARRYWPIVRISIRRCQQGGIDTRIHGVEVVGPKPSFWPLLRRQLYVRTSLIYSVQVHSWVADASASAPLTPSQVMKHKMLDVPGRLVKAIKFEQKFADEYLPNAESALVLGQACRSAFSIPILEDLLSRPSNDLERKCLLELMLDAYITCNEQKKKPLVDAFIFSSKLRRLLRLVVDLDQGGGVRSNPTAPASKTSKGQGEEHGITVFGKRVQPFHKRWTTGEPKISHADSTTSLATAVASTKQTGEDSSGSSGDDNEIYEPLSHLPQLAEQWLKAVEKSLVVHFEKAVEPLTEAANVDTCLEFACEIFGKYRFFQKCTEELFGTKSLFTITLNAATWKAVSSLNFETKRKMGYVFNTILHFHILYESSGSEIGRLNKIRSSLENLRQFLTLTSGTNFCDVFEQLYVIMLLARISDSSGMYLELEERICKQFQSSFPNRLPINLLQDVRYSESLNCRFLRSYLERCDMVTSSADVMLFDHVKKMWENFEFLNKDGFKVMVFRPGSCRNFVGHTNVDPDIFERSDSQSGFLMREFELFFKQERTNHTARMFAPGKRPLSIVSDYGYGVLHDTKNNIDIKAKTSDCLALLQFNFTAGVSGSNLSPAGVHRLVAEQVILEFDSNTYHLSDVIERDVDCLQSDDDSLTSLWEVSASLEERFNKTASIVDCTIVNIMKHEQQCTVDSLVEKTIRKCAYQENSPESNSVFCSASFVRARCEHHINLGYIVRKDSGHLLIYNPDEGVQDSAEKDCDPNTTNVPDMSGMPPMNSEAERFTKEFMKNVSKLSGSEAVVENRKESEFVENFHKNAFISNLHQMVTIPAKKSAPATQTPKLRTFFPDDSVSPSDVELGFENAGDVGSMLNYMSFSTNMQHTTISSESLLLELRVKIVKIAEILLLDNDDVEALMINFEWNAVKLIDSYVNDPIKTMKLIGVPGSEDTDTGSTTTDDEHCPVCLNPFLGSTLDVQNCKHKCCLDCWKTYLSTKLDQDMACTTTCPIGSCRTRITTKYFFSVFQNDPSKQKKYDLSLVRSFVECDRSYTWCHNPKGCNCIIRKAKDGRDEGWCTDCGWQTCFTCTYVEAHYPASCSHMSQWMDDGGYYEGMSEDAQSKHLARLIAKRCPNCQAHIEKNDGCLHMKCIKCSHDFCWRCLQPWRPTHRDYYNCSSKVSKLAQSNMKFVEFNKRCQHHNMAKAFAYSIRDRLHSLDSFKDPEKLHYAMDLCMKLAYCRRILAYCNVFNFYSTDTDRLNNIGLHSVVLESKTLLLQEHLSKVLLGSADIQNMVSKISEDSIAEGRVIISDCESSIKSIVEFSKQGMKIANPSSTEGGQLTMTDAGTLLQAVGSSETQVAMNARPAGMSDEDDSENGMTENTQSEDNNQSEDEDLDTEEDVNMYSSDDEDNDMHYDSGGGGLMDFDSDDDNMIPLSGSDYSGFD